MKRTAIFIIITALCLTMVFPATLSSVATATETEVLTLDFSDVTDTSMWGEDVDYNGTLVAPRSILFTNSDGTPNVSASKANITFDGSSGNVALRFRSNNGNVEHAAQTPITLKAKTSYRIVAKVNTSDAPTYFNIGVSDAQSNVLGQVSITEKVSFTDFQSQVFTTGDSGDLNLFLVLKVSQGKMARVKYIKIYEISEAGEKVLTAKEEFLNYYHTFNFSDINLYGTPLTDGGTDYRSLEFANENGKANVTNNGKVYYYKDSDKPRAGIRIKADSAGTYTCNKDVTLKPNTEYVMAVYGRVMTEGTLNVFCNDKSGTTIPDSTVALSGSNNGYYTSVFTTGDDPDNKLVLNYVTTDHGSGYIFNISLYPLKTSPVNGNFETNVMTGWAQSTTTHSVISTSAKKGGNSVKILNGSVILTYYKALAGKNTFYAWVKSNSNDTTVEQTAYIYKMPVGQCNSIDSGGLMIASGSVAAPFDGGYKLIKFDFVVEEDTLVALKFAPNTKEFWADLIYSLPEGPASADFESGLDGFVDTVVKSDNDWRAQTCATLVETGEDNTAIYLNGTEYTSEAEKVISLKPNTKYTVNLDVKVLAGTASGEDGPKPEIMIVDLKDTDNSNILKEAFVPNTDNDWEHHSYEITTGSDDSLYRIVLRDNLGSAAYYDNISVVEKLNGDLNGDTFIDDNDLLIMRRKLLSVSVLENVDYDINTDGEVDIRDLVCLKKKILK